MELEKSLMKRILIPLVFTLALPAALAWGLDLSDVKITKENNRWVVNGRFMDGTIEADGCMTRLRVLFPEDSRVHAPSFIKAGLGLPNETGIGGSRGAYFYQQGIVSLTDVRQEGPKSLFAQGEKASIRYEFNAADLRWYLTNKTDKPMQFFLVLRPNVNAVANEEGVLLRTPAIQLWPTTHWFLDQHKLTITGGNRIWGPAAVVGFPLDNRVGQFQVWEATLEPKESRTVTLTPAAATPAERAALEATGPQVPNRGNGPSFMLNPQPAVAGELTLFSPANYQVFQRQSRHRGRVIVSGEPRVPCDRIEVRFVGKSLRGPLPGNWQEIPLDAVLRSFSAELSTPAGGWYQLEARALRNGKPVATAVVAHVGVGEVFIGCGQSNSTNCGGARMNTTTGMVATFSGEDWRLASDPQPGTYDDSNRGSFWPAFGDALYAKYQVPIAVAVTGQGGAPVSNWRPGTPAFVWTLTRMNQLGKGGFRGMIWHQGESNVRGTSEEYFQALSTTIAASYAAAGWKFPWFVAQVSYTNPKEPTHSSTRTAQKQLWDAGIALEGPDTDTLIGDDRDGAHFSAKGLKKHGEMWAGKVSVYLDQILGQ